MINYKTLNNFLDRELAIKKKKNNLNEKNRDIRNLKMKRKTGGNNASSQNRLFVLPLQYKNMKNNLKREEVNNKNARHHAMSTLKKFVDRELATNITRVPSGYVTINKQKNLYKNYRDIRNLKMKIKTGVNNASSGVNNVNSLNRLSVLQLQYKNKKNSLKREVNKNAGNHAI